MVELIANSAIKILILHILSYHELIQYNCKNYV